jgi:integrase
MTQLKERSPHKCRHTFLTWFYGETLEDLFLAEWVGGHRDKRSLEVYSHMREQLGREQQFKEQGFQKMKRVY